MSFMSISRRYAWISFSWSSWVRKRDFASPVFDYSSAFASSSYCSRYWCFSSAFLSSLTAESTRLSCFRFASSKSRICYVWSATSLSRSPIYEWSWATLSCSCLLSASNSCWSVPSLTSTCFMVIACISSFFYFSWRSVTRSWTVTYSLGWSFSPANLTGSV